MATVFGASLFVLGCSDPFTGVPGGNGRLTVLLTDAPFPFDLVSEANVTIGRVDIVGESGVQTILEEERIFNLLDLQNGVTAVLAEAALPPGRYPQLRLIVSSASVLLMDGRSFDLFVPSGSQTGLKILLADFEVAADGATTLTLDFDVSDSFIVQGNAETAAGIRGFIFRPVVKPLGFTVE
jgi:hypothetical protein